MEKLGTKFYTWETDPITGLRKKILIKETEEYIDREWLKKTLDRNYKSRRIDDLK